MHHPPFATGITYMDNYGLNNAADFGKVIGRHPQVERILCGHLHRAIDRRFAGTVAGTAPSTAHQIRINLVPDASISFNFEPPGYQLHTWQDGSLVTHTAFWENGSSRCYRGPSNVDGKTFTTDQAPLDTALQHGLKQSAQQVAVAKAAMPVLREGRVIGHLASQAEAAEPAVRQFQVDFLAQPLLGADAEAVGDDQHPDQQFRVDRGPTLLAVIGRQLLPQPVEFDEPVDRAQKVPSGT
jgi:hypothetical protein